MEMSLVFIVYSLLFVKVLVFCITNTSNLTVSSNKINVSVLNESVSGVHCLLLIVINFVKVLIFYITNMSNQTVSSNKINVPVLNGSVSGVHCLLHIVCQGTFILYYQYV